MARIFITGSTDGLGLLAAKSLIAQGHQVIMHARNEKRKEEVLKNVSGAEKILVADLCNIEEGIHLAHQVNSLGKLDAVIHNAGVYNVPARDLFNVNVLAPYVLSCLIEKPKRLIYLSSDMHLGGHSKLDLLKSNINSITYSDSKLQVLMLSKFVANAWPDVYANAVNPGWVPTKMGGKGAPDNLQKGFETQVWLSVSNDEEVKVSGNYFFHKKPKHYNPEANDRSLQERLATICGEMTQVEFGI